MENTDNSETSFFSDFNLDFIKDIFLKFDFDFDFQPYTKLVGDTDQQPQDYLLNCEIGTMYNIHTESCEPHNEICHPTTQKKMQSSSDPGGWPPRCECKDENNNILEGYNPDNNCNTCKNIISENQLGYIWNGENCIPQQDPSLNGCLISDEWFNNERHTRENEPETGMCSYCHTNERDNHYDPTTDCQFCLPDYVRSTDGNSCIDCKNDGTATSSDQYQPEHCTCPANQMWVQPEDGSPNVCNVCGSDGLIININDNLKKCFDKRYFHCDSPSDNQMSCSGCADGYISKGSNIGPQENGDNEEDFNEYLFCKPDFQNMNFYHSFLVNTLNISEDLIPDLNIPNSNLCGTSGNYTQDLNEANQLRLVQNFKTAWNNADTENIDTETLQSIYEQVYVNNKYLDNICQCTQSEEEQSGTTPAGTRVITSGFTGVDITKMYPNCDKTYGCPSPLENDVIEDPCQNASKCISPTTKTYQNLPGASEFWHWGPSDTPPYFNDEVSLDAYFTIAPTSTHACICNEGYCGINCDISSPGIQKPNYENLDPTDDDANCIGATCKPGFCGVLCDQNIGDSDNISDKNDDTQACICEEGYCGENCEYSGPGIQGADPDNNNSCICLDNNRYVNGPNNQCEIDLLNFCDFKDHFTSTIGNDHLISSCTYPEDANLDENNYTISTEPDPCNRNIAQNLAPTTPVSWLGLSRSSGRTQYIGNYITEPEILPNRVFSIYLNQRDYGRDSFSLILYITLEPRSDNGRSNFFELRKRLENSYIFLHTDEINDQLYPNFFKVDGFTQLRTPDGNRNFVYRPFAYLYLNIDDFNHTDGTTISYNFPWPQGSTGRVDRIDNTAGDTIVYYPVAVSDGSGNYTGGPNIIIPSSCDYCPNNYIFDSNSNRCHSCNPRQEGRSYSNLASRKITNDMNNDFSDADNQCDCNEGWNVNTYCSSCAENYYDDGTGTCIGICDENYYYDNGQCVECPANSTRTNNALVNSNEDQSLSRCICNENYYYDNGQCLECPNGSTRTNNALVNSNEDQTTCDCTSISNWSPSPYDSGVNQRYTSISNIEDEATKAGSGGPLDGPTCETCPNDHYWSPETNSSKYKRAAQCSKCYLFDFDFNTRGYELSSEQNPSGFTFNTQNIPRFNNTPYSLTGDTNTQPGGCNCPPGYEWTEPVCTRQPNLMGTRNYRSTFECDYGCQLSQIPETTPSAEFNQCIPNPNMGYCKQKHCTCLIDGSPRPNEIAEDVDPVGTDCPEDGQHLCLQCGSNSDLYTGGARSDIIMYQNGEYQMEGRGGANFSSDFSKSTPTIRYENGQCNTVQCQCTGGTPATELSEGCINNNNNYKCKSCDPGYVLIDQADDADLILRAESSDDGTNWGGNIYNTFGAGSCYPKQDAGGACSTNDHCGTTTNSPPSGWATAAGQSLTCKTMESGTDYWSTWVQQNPATYYGRFGYTLGEVPRCYLSKGAVCEDQGADAASDGQQDSWCINYPSNDDACEDKYPFEDDKCRS